MLSSIAQATSSAPAGFWDWAAASLSAGDIISGGGLLTIVVLFYTNRILTIGQHRSRVEDITKAHEARVNELVKAQDVRIAELVKAHEARVAELVEYHAARLADRDDRYREMTEARDYWRTAADNEKSAREQAEEVARELSQEYAKLTNHLLGSFVQAAEDVTS
jgi:hypothetical protein